MTNRDKLKQIKLDYGLTRQQLAGYAASPLASMNNWLAPDSSKSSRSCKDSIIELIEMRLKRKNKVNAS